MHASLCAALNHVAAFEGGYVYHPQDPGGCTNRGITLATYRRHLKANGTCQDLKHLTWGQAADIYRDSYWPAVKADALPAGVDLLVFDHGVNAGPDRAVRILQRLVDTARDGIIGPITLAAVARWELPTLIDHYAEARLAYYRSLHHWKTFGRGWTRRTEAARALAHTLANEKDDPAEVQPLRGHA